MSYKKALVIGIDAYPRNPLKGCVNDARDFAELMRFNEDGSPNCEVDFRPDVPTKAALAALVKDFFTGDSMTAVLYFSGHGFVNELGGTIVTPDARAFDEGLSMNMILQLANASACRNKIIILDCCHSGAFGEPHLAGGISTHIGEGLTVLTASKKDQAAMESGGHGVFTNLLLGALRGGAANCSGYITPGSVYAYIDQALTEFEQRPVFKTNISRFSSLREVNPRVPKEVLRKISLYFAAPDGVYLLDPSYEDTNTLALPGNVAIFKDLQKLQSIGLVEPVNTPFMFYAAMEGKGCRLTAPGQHYWRLAKKGRVY